jgi:hypothetical protein
MRFVFGNPNHWRMHLGWQEMLKVNMSMATRRTTPNIYRENNVPSSKKPQPTRLTPQQLEERKAKGVCFNYDNKYSKGHKCGEKKLFYIDCEEEEKQEQEQEQEQEPSQDENVDMISSEDLTPMISCNALAEISTPQTLKIEGYIKNKKVIVLIDSGSTHNSIHYKLAKALNCFVYPVEQLRGGVNKLLPCLNNYTYFKLFTEHSMTITKM